MQIPPFSRRIIKFGVFEADLVAGELRKNGIKLRLQEQPFQVLAALLENPGKVITREELRGKIWPSDTFIDFDRGLNTAINKIREALGDSAETPRFVETIPRRGYRFLEIVAENGPEIINSIAVFPFINTSTDPDAEYLAVGIPGGIVQSLSQIPELKVIAWSTVSGYKDREAALQASVGEVEARAVLLGRIWQRGSRLRVQVDLVSAATGEELWGEQYDRDVAEVFSVQDQISREVSHKLRLKLTGEQAARLSKRHTENIEAYQLYLRGRGNNEKRTAQGFKKAFECLTEAIRKDPNYALAYAELSHCVHMPAYYGRVSPHEAYPKARQLALKALEMDDTLAEANDTLATVMQNYDYNWAGAERGYKRAIELNPNYTVARVHYSMHLAWLGRFEEAIHQAKEGQSRDPMSGIMNAGLAFVLVAARLFDWCIEQSLIAIDVDPNVSFTYFCLATAYEMKGMYQKAIATHEAGLAIGGSVPVHKPMMAHVCARSGDKARACGILDELHEFSRSSYLPRWSLAIVYEGLGERKLAIEALQTAVENREAMSVTTKVWPHFDQLRDDPHFQEIQRRVGLSS